MAIDETKLNIAERERLNKLIEEGATKEEALLQLAKERLGVLEDQNAQLDDNIKKQQARIDILKAANAESEKGYAIRERNRTILEYEAKQQADILQLIVNKVFEGKKLTEQEKELYDAAGGTLEKIAEQLKVTKGIAAAREAINKEVRGETGFQIAINKALYKAVALSEERNLLAVGHKQALMGIESMMSKLWKTSIEAMFGMDQAISDFNKTFQLGEQYTDQIESTYKAMNEMGVSIEDASKATQDLIQNVSDFTMMSAAQQQSLTATAARFNELGVSTSTSTQIMQASIKAFGLGAENMDDTIGGLAANARALGVDQTTYFNQLQQNTGALAKFGDQAIDTFKDLQHVQKITGMEMEKILAITNKFDTFEGAAEQAGKLNAALGGNMVNAMDLMMETNPAARFEQIRDAILDTGLTFDDMSYYQKQFYMNSLGLNDVGELAEMLSGDLNDLAGAGNESAESLIEQRNRAKDAQSVMEAYKNIIADNSEGLIAIGKQLNKFTSFLLKNSELVKIVVGGLILYRAGLLAVGAVKTALAIKTALATTATAAYNLMKGKSIAVQQADTASKMANNKAQDRQNKLQMKGQAGMASSIPVMLAFGAAVMMIGAGVGVAALGIGFMAAQVAKLNADQLNAFTTALAILGATIVGLMITLALMVKFAAVGVAVLIAFGQAVALIGVGVLAAGAGIALMAHGMQSMSESIEVEKLAHLGAFFVGLGLAAPLIAVGGVGLMVLAVGLSAVALALALVPLDKMNSLAMFTASLAVTEVEQLAKLASTIKEITKAMDEVPARKSIAISKAIDSVTTAAVVMKAMGVIGPQPGGATTNNAVAYQSGTGASGSPQVIYKQPVEVVLNGEKMGSTVIDIIGEAVMKFNGLG